MKNNSRAELLDEVLDEELPRYAEARDRLGQAEQGLRLCVLPLAFDARGFYGCEEQAPDVRVEIWDHPRRREPRWRSRTSK